MSLFAPVKVVCPSCKQSSDVQLSASVNGARRPELREAVLDGSFQAEACPYCSAPMRLPPRLTYVDVTRGQWIAVQPVTELVDWQAGEDIAKRAFAENFGDAAPETSREVGANLRPRLVFGWPALREKLLADDLGLNDITLELLKIAVMRNLDRSPMADQTELRLTGGDAANLRLDWLVSETEAPLSGVTVPGDIYTDIAGDAWAAARDPFEGVFFVDVKRLLEPGRAEAA